MGRVHNVAQGFKAFLSATATGILLFLFWDVLKGAIDPVESALNASNWGRFSWLSALALGGFAAGLLSLVYYDSWMKARRRRSFLGPGAASATELRRSHFTGLTPARWLALFIAMGIGLHNFSEGLAIGQSAAQDQLSLAYLLVIGFGLHNATEGFGIVAPLAGGSILYVVMELLNVCRLFTSKTVTAWGILLGITLGFATDFVLVAAGV